MTKYPNEKEPDNNWKAPHHWHQGVLLMVISFPVWSQYPKMGATLGLVGLLVASDDWINHALGVRTPLDEIFKQVMKNDKIRAQYMKLQRKYWSKQ